MRIAALALATAVLVATGHGALEPPPFTSLDGVADWFATRDAATATLAIVRLLALVAAAWLALLSLVATAARALGLLRLAGAAERGLPRSLRRVAAGLAGTGIVLAVSAPPAPAGAQAVSAAPTVMTMTSLPPGDSAAPAPASVPAPPPAADDTWTVAAGESFWSIAAEVLVDVRGREVADEEVEPYWRALVEANRDRLVTASADLLYRGQELVLPPVP